MSLYRVLYFFGLLLVPTGGMPKYPDGQEGLSLSVLLFRGGGDANKLKTGLKTRSSKSRALVRPSTITHIQG